MVSLWVVVAAALAVLHGGLVHAHAKARRSSADVCVDTVRAWIALEQKNEINFVQWYLASGHGIGDMGNYAECAGLPNTAFYVVRFQVHLHNKVKWNSTNGLCVPDVCSEADVNASASVLLSDLGALDQRNLELLWRLELVRRVEPQPKHIAFWVVVFSFVGLAALTVLATVANAALSGRETSGIQSPVKDERHPLLKRARVSIFRGLLSCFDLARSFRAFQLPSRSPVRGIVALDGIRVLSMLWIILGHTLSMMLGLEAGGNILWDIRSNLQAGSISSNLLYATRTVQSRFSFQVVANASFGIDTFFFLSGFLAIRQLTTYFEKTGAVPRGRKAVAWGGTMCVQRYLRLTPLYMCALVIFFFTLPYFAVGPYWDLWQQQSTYRTCSQFWWTNALYINNLYPHQLSNDTSAGLGCMGWSWFLANDMQLFLLAPPFALLNASYKRVAYAVVVVLAIGSVVATAVIADHHHLSTCVDYTESSRATASYDTAIYNKPYTRAIPYLFGMLSAMLYGNTLARDGLPHQAKGDWAFRGMFWFVMLAFLGVPLWVTYDQRRAAGSEVGECVWSQLADTAYIALHRVSWSLGLCVLVLGVLWGWLEPIVYLLTLAIWTPLSRLVYAAYLLHPIFGYWMFYSGSAPASFDDMSAATAYVSNVALTFVGAFAVYLLVESPFQQLHSFILRRRRTR